MREGGRRAKDRQEQPVDLVELKEKGVGSSSSDGAELGHHCGQRRRRPGSRHVVQATSRNEAGPGKAGNGSKSERHDALELHKENIIDALAKPVV